MIVGKSYEAIGPAPGGKWEPPRVTVVGITSAGYRTEGKRQAATLITFGAAQFWKPLP